MRIELIAAFAALTTACAGAAPDDTQAQPGRTTAALPAPSSSGSAGHHIPFGPEGPPVIGAPVRPSPPCLSLAHPPITYVPLDAPAQSLTQGDVTAARVGDELDQPCTPIENPIGAAP